MKDDDDFFYAPYLDKIKSTSQSVEFFAVFSNIGISLMQLNQELKKFGFEFVNFTLTEFEDSFSELYHIPAKANLTKSCTFNDNREIFIPGKLISQEFKYALGSNLWFNRNQYEHGNLLLLKKLPTSIVTGKEDFGVQDISNQLKNTTKFSRNLLQALHLLKSENVALTGVFCIAKEERSILSITKFSNNLSINGADEFLGMDDVDVYWKPVYYEINNTEIEKLISYLSIESKNWSFLKFPYLAYEQSFDIVDVNLKFIVLIIGFESIFNVSSQIPISHILSRHAAILLSENLNEFHRISKRIKEFYILRNNIVHGKTEKSSKKAFFPNLSDALELSEILRQIINKLLWIEEIDTKEKLFEYLNKKGFEG